MTVKTAGLLLALVMLAVLAAGLWHQFSNPRRIVATGEVRLVGTDQPSAGITLATRVVMVGSVRLEEVRMPNGTWIDCARDCGRAAREAGPEFWETIRRNSGGR